MDPCHAMFAFRLLRPPFARLLRLALRLGRGAPLGLGAAALVACSGATADVGGGGSSSSSSSGSSGGSSGGELGAPTAPPAVAYGGTASGCGNVFAYRASADGTQFVTVEVQTDALGMKPGDKRVIDLGSAPASVRVAVEVFARAPKEPYCTDFGSEKVASTTWSAEAGTLAIELGPKAASSAGSGPSESYRATLRLQNVRLVGPERGTSVIVPTISIDDVLVGWLPG